MIKVRSGFTIVEVMFFLAISGLLLSAVIFNSTNSINLQRYRDSILSLQEFIQTEYNKTVNASNLIASSFECSMNSSSLTINTSSGTKNKGQSNCLLLGRYITTGSSTDGTKIFSYSVVGSKFQNSSRIDLDSLKNDYYINYDSANIISTSETYNLTWGAYMQNKNSTKSVFSLLIIRSPDSSNVYSLASIGSTKNASELINDNNSISNDLVLCVSKLTSAGDMMGVKVVANSSNSTGVLYIGDADTSGACK